jgi:hypothetical protein
MTRLTSPHPDREALLQWIDQELEDAESQRLSRHMAGCEPCRNEVVLLRDALHDYERFHSRVLKASLPPPPDPWKPLDLRVAEFRTSSYQVRSLLSRTKLWVAAAAIVILGFILVRRFAQAPEVSAAELLAKAASAEQASPVPKRRIRIHTGKRILDRPAHIPPMDARTPPDAGDAAELKRMFDRSGYSWEDPLSAESFSRWRERLSEKRDEVLELPSRRSVERYIIDTSTSTGPISEARLTLGARNFQAIKCTLHFRSEETVDITELTEDQPATSPPPPAAASPTPTPAAPPASPRNTPVLVGPETELQVIAALHAIGADLGEPIEINRSSRGVIVSVTGMTDRRREQVRNVVSEIPGVEVQLQPTRGRLTQDGLSTGRDLVVSGSANPLVSELEAARAGASLASQIRDELIDETDAAMERAYATRALAKRFPRTVEESLPPSGRVVLDGIVHDHVAALERSMASLRALLAPILPPEASETVPPSQEMDWQTAAGEILTAMRQFDQTLNSGDISMTVAERKARLTQTLRAMSADIGALRKPAR